MTRRSIPAFLLMAVLSVSSWSVAQTTPAPKNPPPSVKPPQAEASAAIQWLGYGPEAFRQAINGRKLILLVLEMPWSADCLTARKSLWENREIAAFVNQNMVPIRERADLRPDLMRRYPAEGWPAVTLLYPDGLPLVVQDEAKTQTTRVTLGGLPADKTLQLLKNSVAFFRSEAKTAHALAVEQEDQAEKKGLPESGPIAEEQIWGVATQQRITFDPERRYFGGTPRLPKFELIEFMLNLGSEKEDPWRTVGIAALDTLSAKLSDPQDGALFRAAGGLDWENVQKEKLLDRNARFLDLLTLAWRVTGKGTYRAHAQKLADFMVQAYGLPDGFFRFASAEQPYLGDDIPLTGPNALAAASLIRAGAVLGNQALIDRGLQAVRLLKERRFAPGKLAPRAVKDGMGILEGNLEDQAQLGLAFLTAFEITGDKSFLAAAESLARTTLANLRPAPEKPLLDILPSGSAAPRPLRRTVYPLNANAEFCRLLIRLFYQTENKDFRRAAQNVLMAFAKKGAEASVYQPNYGLALFEFFMPPMNVAVVGDAKDRATQELYRAAFASPHPYIISRGFDPQIDAAKIHALRLPVGSQARLVAFHAGASSAPIDDPKAVRGAIAGLRESVAKKAAAERENRLKEGKGTQPESTPTPSGPPPRVPKGSPK